MVIYLNILCKYGLTLSARGPSLYVSIRRQMLMYEDGPRAERIRIFIMAVGPQHRYSNEAERVQVIYDNFRIGFRPKYFRVVWVELLDNYCLIYPVNPCAARTIHIFSINIHCSSKQHPLALPARNQSSPL